MKKGLILAGLLFLYSCDVSENLEKVRASVDGFFGEDKAGAKTVSLEAIPSGTENKDGAEANKNLLITTDDSTEKNVDVLDRVKSDDESGKDVISMTGDSQSMGDTEDDSEKLDRSLAKGIKPKTSSSHSISKSSPNLAEYVDIRPLLLKGQYERAFRAQVNENDPKNRYYRAIATYNVARKTGSEKYALLADKRFCELSNDRKMKNLRLRAVLWLGINGYSNLLHKKSLAEQIRPFDYLLKNYPTTRYANDAVFYKMLVYMKAKEKDAALKMWKQLKNFKEDDLIYDVDHSEWVGQGKLLKRYGSFFESAAVMKPKSGGLRRVASAAPQKSLDRKGKTNFQLGELTKEQENRISENKPTETAQTEPKEIQNLKDKEGGFNYSDAEASKKILGEGQSDKPNVEALDAALDKDEKDLSKLESAKNLAPTNSDETVKKSVADSSEKTESAVKVAGEKDSSASSKTAQAPEASQVDKAAQVDKSEKSTASVDGMMKDMDNIISGY